MAPERLHGTDTTQRWHPVACAIVEGEVAAGNDAVLVPSRPDVIDEVIAGEAVIVHLGSGRYFALNPAATELWVWFGPGRSTAELAAVLDAAPAPWEAAARPLVDAWVDEQVLVSEPSGADREPGGTSPITAAVPEMRTFTDLEDLLLLDPIHDIEVGADGFPTARPQHTG